MRKLLQVIMLVCATAICVVTKAQTQETPVFIPKVLPPIPLNVFDSDSVRVSRIDGLIDGQAAFNLRLENKTGKSVSFCLQLIDKNGFVQVMFLDIVLAPNEVVDYTTKRSETLVLSFKTSERLDPATLTVKVGASIGRVLPFTEEPVKLDEPVIINEPVEVDHD